MGTVYMHLRDAITKHIAMCRGKVAGFGSRWSELKPRSGPSGNPAVSVGLSLMCGMQSSSSDNHQVRGASEGVQGRCVHAHVISLLSMGRMLSTWYAASSHRTGSATTGWCLPMQVVLARIEETAAAIAELREESARLQKVS
jgi:hypothetical protein